MKSNNQNSLLQHFSAAPSWSNAGSLPCSQRRRWTPRWSCEPRASCEVPRTTWWPGCTWTHQALEGGGAKSQSERERNTETDKVADNWTAWYHRWPGSTGCTSTCAGPGMWRRGWCRCDRSGNGRWCWMWSLVAAAHTHTEQSVCGDGGANRVWSHLSLLLEWTLSDTTPLALLLKKGL